MTTPKTATVPTVEPETEPTRPPCLCGCGGTPKGKKARFLPGHDARYHSDQKKAAAETAVETPIEPERRERAPRGRKVKGDTSVALPKDGKA